MPLDLRFPVASVTKTLTALLAARLSVDGVVPWVDLRALLTHTAGVPFELYPGHWTGPSLTEQELAGAMSHAPRMPLPPGTWHYSNFGYAMAAGLLERATGRDYASLLADHVLRPLGMTMTSLPDEATEGRPVLGAAAPAGDLWSTLGDLMTLARAVAGGRPDVVTRPMLALLLDTVVPLDGDSCAGAGIRTVRVGHHQVLVTSGTIRNRTTCVVVWPRRGTSVLVAEAGYSHDALRDEATAHWRRDDTVGRSWWWDGQEVLELRYGSEVELVVRETTWPFALFSGQASGPRLVGLDWRGEPLELLDRGDALIGPGMMLTADVADSAYATPEQP